MVWIAVYSALAIVAAAAVFLVAEWNRVPGVPAPEGPGRYAVVAGFIWPVLIVGVAQWGLIAAVQTRMRRSTRRVPEPQAPQPALR